MATISARKLDYETLKSKLNPGDAIAIVSCDCCARLSAGLGGRDSMDRLAARLEADGFRVIRKSLPTEACYPEALAQCADPNEVTETPTVVIPLACEVGEDVVARAMDPIPVLRISKTPGRGHDVPGKGMCLTEPHPDIPLDIDPDEGMPIDEAAKRLGLFPGGF